MQRVPFHAVNVELLKTSANGAAELEFIDSDGNRQPVTLNLGARGKLTIGLVAAHPVDEAWATDDSMCVLTAQDLRLYAMDDDIATYLEVFLGKSHAAHIELPEPLIELLGKQIAGHQMRPESKTIN